MSEPLTPEYEAEIRERIARLEDDQTFPGAVWLASSVSENSALPPEQSHVVEDVVETASFVTRASVGVFGDKRHAEFTAHARDDVPALLAEIDRLRAALQTNEFLAALRLIHEDMHKARCGGDEWASEWLNDLWIRLPLKLRALAGDDEALSELAAEGGNR
jgi:hypothetical protein